MDVKGAGSNSWSISDFADNIADDIQAAGSGLASAVRDIGSLADDGWGGIMGDIGRGLQEIGTSLFNAGKELIDTFSSPGAINPPPYNDGGLGGWNPGQVDGPTDTGPIGTPGGDFGVSGPEYNTPVATDSGNSTTSDVTVNPNLGTGDHELDAILNDKGASIEDKIFALMLKLQDKKEKELDNLVQGFGDKEGSKLSQKDLVNLQRLQNDLGSLNSLTTNIMKNYKDMKDAIIGNIR